LSCMKSSCWKKKTHREKKTTDAMKRGLEKKRCIFVTSKGFCRNTQSMGKFFSQLLLTLLICQNLKAQVIDRAPTGGENILPVEGGCIVMKIDSITTLNKLIDKLNDNWEFIETGKQYWIGYTNDMFSIAARGDEAIPALINFFKTTQKNKGKIGAIYTLHLIGIHRQIVGRFYEKFINHKARIALLGLLKEKGYTNSIVELLKRNPWQSDIPYFFQILKSKTDDEIIWPIINSLSRYKIKTLPINGQLTNPLSDLSIQLKVENENVLERDFDFNAQLKEALKEFSNNHPQSIKIEKELYNEDLAKGYRTKLPSTTSINELLTRLGIEPNSPFNYSQIGCKIQYYVQDEKLYFCTIKTAQERINKWWVNLPIEEKEKFK
jgi:hypothetical protein